MSDSIVSHICYKLSKKAGRVMSYDDLHDIIQSIQPNISRASLNKVIFLVRAKGYIHNLKKELYYISDPKYEFSEQDIINNFYRKILKTHCDKYGKSRHIGSSKALEFKLQNYSIPNDIVIMNPDRISVDTLFANHKIFYKSYKDASQNYYSKIKKYTELISLDSKKIRIANINLSILESLYSPSPDHEHDVYELVKKIIKKYKKQINVDQLAEIIKMGKYHTSINRLYKLTQAIDSTLAQQIYIIIKKYSYVIM